MKKFLSLLNIIIKSVVLETSLVSDKFNPAYGKFLSLSFSLWLIPIAIITCDYYVINVTILRTSWYSHLLLWLSSFYVWSLFLLFPYLWKSFSIDLHTSITLVFTTVSNLYSFKEILISPGNEINYGLLALFLCSEY